MTRAKLEALVEDLIKRTMPPCETALKDAGLSASEIDEIVLVGGMTRMPKIIEEVKNFFASLPTHPCYQYSCKKSIGPMDCLSLQAKREVWQVHRQCY